ncbi:hypothetical protein L1987_10100 [Smallanthus sonchifolius]|uniref:Uncharacterized protein n=1 Tax=Smallanthus sonchifolius TaxID=185202 RepID=A0ACB9JR57_9ASTR|nr:hypothetical protein L1987_10100 [Smallanthus sonchifolius]
MVYNLLLEYGSGGTLADLIRKSSRNGLLESDVKRHTRSILSGLRHIHRSGQEFLERSLKEIWEIDVGGCIKVTTDGITVITHTEFLEEMCALVFASSAVFGSRVEVEGVIAGLRELAVANDFTAEVGVHGV